MGGIGLSQYCLDSVDTALRGVLLATSIGLGRAHKLQSQGAITRSNHKLRSRSVLAWVVIGGAKVC